MHISMYNFQFHLFFKMFRIPRGNFKFFEIFFCTILQKTILLQFLKKINYNEYEIKHFFLDIIGFRLFLGIFFIVKAGQSIQFSQKKFIS